jgi:DUF4097 and DUF4098 domain-containing protein YvlB
MTPAREQLTTTHHHPAREGRTMTNFPTTGPITAAIDVQWGDIHVVAEGAGDTIVEVTPTDPSNEKDRLAAAATTVTCIDGRLSVAGAKNRTGSFNKKYGSVQVSVELAEGSELDLDSALGGIFVRGEAGGCRAKTAAGDVRVERATSASLRTGMGSVVAGDIAGEVFCSTGTGAVQIDRIGGRAEVKNANGDTRIGDSGGPLRVKSANGSVSIDRARSAVVATTANGHLRVGRAEGGAVQLKTSMGRIEVGIPAGTSALLDLSTSFGVVRNELGASDQPAAGDRTVEVHAQTSAGDIDVVRAAVDDS